MCGIAGFSLSPADVGSVNSRKLAHDLLLGIEHRGKDATGIAWWSKAGEVIIDKTDKTATEYLKLGRGSIGRSTHAAICHVRLATQGSKKNAVNNHPVRTGHITGVHNGVIWNDDELFEEMQCVRHGQVDTESIFAAIAHGEDKLDKDLLKRLEYISGSMAIGWFEDETPGILQLAKGEQSPLVVAVTASGSFIFASEWDAIEDATKAQGLVVKWQHHCQPGTYMKVEHGNITHTASFDPGDRAWDIVSYGGGGYYHRGEYFTSPTPIWLHGENTRTIDRDVFQKRIKHDWDAKKWAAAYHDREVNIAKLGDKAPLRTRAFASLYPGQFVMTTVGGECYDAEVIAMPKELTGGRYLLRVHIPGKQKWQDEVVLVEKYSTDIDVSFQEEKLAEADEEFAAEKRAIEEDEYQEWERKNAASLVTPNTVPTVLHESLETGATVLALPTGERDKFQKLADEVNNASGLAGTLPSRKAYAPNSEAGGAFSAESASLPRAQYDKAEIARLPLSSIVLDDETGEPVETTDYADGGGDNSLTAEAVEVLLNA